VDDLCLLPQNSAHGVIHNVHFLMEMYTHISCTNPCIAFPLWRKEPKRLTGSIIYNNNTNNNRLPKKYSVLEFNIWWNKIHGRCKILRSLQYAFVYRIFHYTVCRSLCTVLLCSDCVTQLGVMAVWSGYNKLIVWHSSVSWQCGVVIINWLCDTARCHGSVEWL